jgi:hypothetical protein
MNGVLRENLYVREKFLEDECITNEKIIVLAD